MNKIEQFEYRKVMIPERVRELILQGQYWCGIDLLIDHPEVFPIQHMPLEDRRNWAIGAKRNGANFVLVIPKWLNNELFDIIFITKVPRIGIPHIYKAWKQAKEELT
jgi:hypothetical protein